MAANYCDKSLTLLLLPATRMHLMQSGREEEEASVCVCVCVRTSVCVCVCVCVRCIVRSAMFVILSYELFSCRCPFGRPLQGKLDVSTTVEV